ncbi:rhodanese-like domain-containing protein [Rhodovulum strictum]|uniref:Rhodanese-like domain-containing protein n=1 Tax=Rhodovulum strictum TaxID=58314 RepID=A0A844B5B5_9RHOB|nr:rhodanese-like domain-containing protein [Rhodovulum strictum]MRH21391.1 rhodanese-like domain-containing protein [Rhodovulum strictum]
MNALSKSLTALAELEEVRRRARDARLPYAGEVSPDLAWALVQAGEAQLIDVRSREEFKFVGHVPGSSNVAWATGTTLTRNPRFLREFEATAARDAVVLLICRSGKRSADAAAVASRAGFGNVFNVTEGFEGDLDVDGHRGALNGWRQRGLPWLQD